MPHRINRYSVHAKGEKKSPKSTYKYQSIDGFATLVMLMV